MPTAVSFNIQSSKETPISSNSHQMNGYFPTPTGLAVKLKRKWDLSDEEEGEENNDTSSKSKLSHKKLKRTQSHITLNSSNNASNKSLLKTKSFSTPNSPPSSDDDILLSPPQNPSNTNSKSDSSKDEDEFHKSMFQAYVNSAIDNLDKVCFVIRFV